MTAYCNNCGTPLPNAARFCSACGTVIAGAPTAAFSPFAPAPRLSRPLFGRRFAGVCAGIARTTGWDLGLVRTLAIVSGIFLAPVPELVYLACWIGIPDESAAEMPPPQRF